MLKMLHPNPTVQIPSWTLYDYQSPSDSDEDGGEFADPYSSDEFRMYEFKIRRCARGRAHDWTDCPYAHPGEKARRRDPRRFHYSGNPCPDFKKGSCARGDTCEFAHGVFECWLHPARYRTQPCKDGVGCRRRVCFFAHTPEQLRVLSPTAKGRVGVKEGYDGSPARRAAAAVSPARRAAAAVSPTSVMSPEMVSPPVSPDGLMIMMRRMRLGEGFGGLGFGASSPGTPTARRAVFDLEGDGFDEIDVGWVSELVK